MIDKLRIYEPLIERMDAAGISQRELAKMVHVSDATMSRNLTATGMPGDLCVAVGVIFDMPPWELTDDPRISANLKMLGAWPIRGRRNAR